MSFDPFIWIMKQSHCCVNFSGWYLLKYSIFWYVSPNFFYVQCSSYTSSTYQVIVLALPSSYSCIFGLAVFFLLVVCTSHESTTLDIHTFHNLENLKEKKQGWTKRNNRESNKKNPKPSSCKCAGCCPPSWAPVQ
jgi:hypothetical protein